MRKEGERGMGKGQGRRGDEREGIKWRGVGRIVIEGEEVKGKKGGGKGEGKKRKLVRDKVKSAGNGEGKRRGRRIETE